MSKPAGMPCALAPGASHDRFTPNALDMVKRKAKGRLRMVNRIETMASGIVVFARTDRAFESLTAQLRGGDARRIATAIVDRNGQWEAGVEAALKHTLIGGRDGPDRAIPEAEQVGQTGTTSQKTKPARMLVRVEAVSGDRARLRLFMQTAHIGQAPLQLDAHGTPICSLPGRPGMALHHGEMTLTHPATGAPIRLKTDPSDAFAELMGEKPTSTPSWEPVADWYDSLAEERSDHHANTIHPGVTELLGPLGGKRLLDIACGQGALARHLLGLDANRAPKEIVAIDASESLVDLARERTKDDRARFEVMDARELGNADFGEFDAACCVLAAMNIDPIEPVFEACAKMVRPGGRFVVVVLHPAFRIPQNSAWHFDEDARRPTQSRLITRYRSPLSIPITMNPGEVAGGADPVTTTTHHRPLSDYVSALAKPGFAIDAMEEWISARTSQPGPRAAAENQARREIPMFLALRAIRLPPAI